MKQKLRPITAFEKMDESVPGLGTSREIVNGPLIIPTINETEFFDLQDKYIVAFVSDISEDKYNPLKDVQSQNYYNFKKKRFASNKIAQKFHL